MDSFKSESLMPASGVDGSTKRGRTRDSLFLLATVTVDGETAGKEVRVRNLSAGGMMAELDRVVATGTSVAIDLRGVGEIAGKIAWCAEHRVGIAFDHPIDPKRARKPVGKGTTTPGYAKPLV